MALDKNVAELMNKQINEELFSAYLYLTFADYYEDRGLKGFANWYMVQVQEEVSHAKILRRYLLDNDVQVKMPARSTRGTSLSASTAATPPRPTCATSGPCSCSTGL